MKTTLCERREGKGFVVEQDQGVRGRRGGVRGKEVDERDEEGEKDEWTPVEWKRGLKWREDLRRSRSTEVPRRWALRVTGEFK